MIGVGEKCILGNFVICNWRILCNENFNLYACIHNQNYQVKADEMGREGMHACRVLVEKPEDPDIGGRLILKWTSEE
jgi:hypothetical protein